MSKKKMKTEAISAPQTREECAQAIAELGIMMALRDNAKAEMNAKLAEISQRYEAQLDDLKRQIEAKQLAIQVWCEPHWAELAEKGGVRYIEFTTGTVKKRKAPDSISIGRGADVNEIIQHLRQRGLDRFVREVLEINKEAMLAEKAPDYAKTHPGLAVLIHGIPGLSLKEGKDSFYIEPLNIDPS